MTHAVIASTGLFTPEQSVSNAELVDSYNTWADGWNARHAAQIEAGELEAKSHSSPEFIAVSYTHLTLPTNREV